MTIRQWIGMYIYNKTDVERRQTLGHLRSINPNMINPFAKQSPLLLSKSLHEAVKTSYYLRSQRCSRNCTKDVKSLDGCWYTWFGSLSNNAHGYNNLSRLSKNTLSIKLNLFHDALFWCPGYYHDWFIALCKMTSVLEIRLFRASIYAVFY